MGKAAGSLNQMRTIQIVFIVALALYAYTSELLAGRDGTVISTPILCGITIAAGFDVLVALYFRRAKVIPASEKLQRDANDSEALKQWRSSTILCMVLVLSVGLYGLVIRLLGAPRLISWSFYLVALILLLIWRPKLELAADVPAGPAGQ